MIFFFKGNGDPFTIVDTPGFGDSDGNEEQDKLIKEMMTVLKDDLKEANTFLLLMKGTSTRFDAEFQKIIRLMIAMFGKSFWTHVVVGVSFWPYDEFKVKERNRQVNFNSTTSIVKNEAWFMKEWNIQFMEYSFLIVDC